MREEIVLVSNAMILPFL